MRRVGREIAARKLHRYLARCRDEEFFNLVATYVEVVRNGNHKARRHLFDLPVESCNADISSSIYIPRWSLETLTNELLVVPKERPSKDGKMKVMRTNVFGSLKALHIELRRLEDAEDGLFLERHDVLTEMSRLVQRQFPWWRGSANLPSIYRAARIFGTGPANEYFEATSSLPVSAFMKIGVYFFAAFGRGSVVPRHRDLSEANVSAELREAALAKLAIPIAGARAEAKKLRRARANIAYKPSVLRRFPIICFGPVGERLRSPLNELIMERVTSGLYYDVVGGGSSVWRHSGAEFEGYCREYFQAMLAPLEVEGEYDIGTRKHPLKSPDVLVSASGKLVAIIECKATKMSIRARFGDDPVTEARRAFEEIANGIFQMWCFVSRARQRKVPEES